MCCYVYVTGEQLSSFNDEHRRFVSRIDALDATFSASVRVLLKENREVREEFERFQRDRTFTFTSEGDEAEKTGLRIPPESYQEYRNLRRRVQNTRHALPMLTSSMIVALVTQYDTFLGRLIRTIFTVKPELLNTSERNISFSELVHFGTVENARNFIIEREIDAILRLSHADQLHTLEKKLGMVLTKGLAFWSDFIEITERRNLFVHTGGVVSAQYLAVCKEHKVNLEPTAELGRTVRVSPDYYTNALDTFIELGVGLVQVIWRKYVPEEIEQADNALADAIYDALIRKRYELVKRLTRLALKTLPRLSSAIIRYTFVVNEIIAYKWGIEKERAKAEQLLDAVDWSATNTTFQLAVLVLKNDFVNAASLMRTLGKSMDPMHYIDWPLFQDFRLSTEYQEAFIEVYGEGWDLFLMGTGFQNLKPVNLQSLQENS
jgi:hypothetical protein